MSDQGKEAISRIKVMADDRRQQAEGWWKETAEILIPRLQDLDGTKTQEALMAPGAYDSQGRSSLDIAGNAVFSLMCGPSVDWISLGMFHNVDVMRDHASREYFDLLRMALLDGLYAYGFYENVKPAVEYAMSLGTVAVTVSRDIGVDAIDYILWHPGDVYIRKGGDRRIHEVAFKQKVRQKELLKYPDLDKKTLDDIKRDPNKKIFLYYYVGKTKDDGEDVLASVGFPYYILHCLSNGEVLHESGLHTLPGAFWTYEADPRMDYGLSPGYHIQRDLLQNNKLRRLLLKETEKRVDPPLWIPETGSSQFFQEPGSENFYNGDPSMFPRRIHDQADVGLAFTMKESIDQIIRTRLYTDFFLAVQSKTNRRTAQEIMATMQEVGAQIAPLVYTVERNFLAPQVKRTLMLLEDMGKLPEPSNMIKREMKNFPLEVNFIGPLSLANKYLYNTQKNTRLLNEVLLPAAQLGPEAIDNVDLNKFVRESALGINGGFSILRDPEEVEAIAQQRAARMQQAQEDQSRMEAMKSTSKAESGSPAEVALNAG